MSIGTRISELRKQNNYSQEYIAEQLDISRQAVSKWEKDLTSPDTGNLIKLAELLGSSVEFLATGRDGEPAVPYVVMQPGQSKKLTKQQKIRFAIASVVAVIFMCTMGGIIYIRNLPVDWDAGACGGGYATYIFDKYEEELVQRYVDGGGYIGDIADIKAVRGTQAATWEEQRIFLQFDIQYEHETEGTIVERLHFIGERKWIDIFEWSGAIIEG